MELQISPEPPDDVRLAIAAALVRADGEAEPAAWWRAGVLDAVDGDAEPES